MRSDFYLLSNGEITHIGQILCRILAKAYAHHHQVWVCCESADQVAWLDALLWTFKEESFIPHLQVGELPNEPSPIRLTHQLQTPTHNDLLLNLSPHVPKFANTFQRTIELVLPNESAKIISRAHYKIYQDFGANIQVHNGKE